MKHSVVFLLLLVSGTCSAYTYRVNLALHGEASQSSVFEGADASRAINGKKTCIWNDGSISHTNGDLNSWWRLDLLKTHKVFSVKVTNRGDAVPERINGAEIRIGDDLVNHVSNPRCALITSIPAGATVEFQCSGGMDGRYVTIVVPGREEYLTLCEVEVYGYPLPTGVNLALDGEASQSSVFEGADAFRAINGKKTCIWNDGSISHTNGDLNSWWRLDLRKTHKVFSVKVTNRGDAVPERINGAEIRIGDDLVNHVSNPRCALITSIPAGATVEFQCFGGMDGRYVTIVVPGREEYLTLCEVEVYGYPLPTGVNLALDGEASQSSVFEGADASRAINGKKTCIWNDGSISHTNGDLNSWWRLDLRKTHKVFSVKVTNRGDAVPERINGAEIRIGDDLVNHVSNPRCALITSIPAGATVEFQCSGGMDGRYVTIVVPGREEYLTLCEVEVYGYPVPTGVNLALDGEASQSSVFEGADAFRAINGKKTCIWNDGSISHTNGDLNSWWRLDLRKTHKVFSVKVTNRGDAVPERINGAEIRIGDDLVNHVSNPRCALITSIPAGATVEFQCFGGMDGRYVTIVVPGREEYLTLCEVEVYGYPLPTGVNLALDGEASQSSVFEGADASRAINGKKTCIWNDGSISHTNGDLNSWWRLDLRKTHKVFSVKVTNRGDAVPERINGAEIRIGDDLVNHVSNPRCALITSIPAGATVEFQCSGGMDGRYVTIVVPGREEYLTLCEVEVYGYPVPTGVNLALDGEASQSSVFEGADAFRAINGKKTCIWNDGSISHTNGDLNSWWRLDLRKTHKVFSVKVTNRGDAVPERINGAEIRIGDDLVNHVSNPRCALITSIPAGATVEFQCFGGMDGRYVTIVVPGREEYLTLCEVEVYGYPVPTGVNLAIHGEASQSSVFEGADASRAINGKKTCIWNDGSLSHTNGDLNSWWRLDLRKTHKVFSVKVTNRGDAVPERINGAEIRIGDDLVNHVSNPRCALITSIPAGATVEFQCFGGMDGRYVTIVVPGREEYLTLCEVEVYGYPVPTGVNLAIHGEASQSSVFEGADASRAINGKKTCIWNDGSLSHTNGDLNSWWRLDLRKTHKVFSVKVTNRGDAVPERINGAEIRIGDDLVNHVSNPRCALITSIPAGATVEFQCFGGMDGRYVTIVVPGREEYLTLCEVEVYGYPVPTGVNLAIHGEASQSSVFEGADASRAINGKKTCIWNDGSLSHTNGDLNSWWRLDLRKTHKVFSVKVTNRGDAVPERINGAEIRIGDDLVNHVSNPRCALITSIPAGATVEFQCSGGMDGRYVTIVVPGREEYLTLCEVEVYGYALD